MIKKLFLKIITIVVAINLVSVTPAPHMYASDSIHINQSGIKYYVVADVVNVRSGPGKNFAKIGSLSKGQIVKVQQVLHFRGMKKNNKWAKFKYMGYTAYISLKHLSKKSPIS